jgi:hypothetical protein
MIEPGAQRELRFSCAASGLLPRSPANGPLERLVSGLCDHDVSAAVPNHQTGLDHMVNRARHAA